MSKLFTYLSSTGKTRKATLWGEVANPRGIVQLVHGMAEHIDRYEDTAKFLNGQGFVVVGHNHPGHGADASIPGYFADKNGWDALLWDIHVIREEMQRCYPGLPYFLLGHSMGSFAARTYALVWERGLAGLILSGTGHFDKPMLLAARGIAAVQCLLGLGKKPGKLLNKISSSGYNKTYQDVQTPFDWLSRDRAQVKRYMEDPLCGFCFKGGGYRDMFTGLYRLLPENLSTMDKRVPVLLFSGSDDPVGNYGQGVQLVADELRAAGVKDVTMKLFEDGRHEMFNETNREECWQYLADWLDQKLASLPPQRGAAQTVEHQGEAEKA